MTPVMFLVSWHDTVALGYDPPTVVVLSWRDPADDQSPSWDWRLSRQTRQLAPTPLHIWLHHTYPWKTTEQRWLNSLAPGRFDWDFRYLILQIISVIDGWGIYSELALRWASLDLTDDKSTLVQVMAWCRQATSHYLSQCWPRSVSPYGVTRPQWVNVRLQ